MNIYENFQNEDMVNSEPLTTSIGAFDGIHLGHKALFENALQVSKGSYQIITFNSIPKVFFNKNLAPLLAPHERISIFKNSMPKNLIFLNFESVNNMTPIAFCNFLKYNLKSDKLVIGKDFKFGKDRKGNVDTLVEFFGESNIYLFEDYFIGSEKVSTTKIRKFYSDGNIKEAEKFLGRIISYTGTVVKGKQLGSSIGIPTANIILTHKIQLPKFGVYAVKVHVKGNSYLGCLNIGVNPTVDVDKITKNEIHILEFNEDIYHQEITYDLLDFIRDEKKFDSIEDLKAQILEDITNIKNNF